jgi:Skp family chaperone for outer membrane proteins
MRKRITLLIAALMLALTMAFGGATAFADTENLCQTHPEHKQCVVTGPGKSEFSQGQAQEKNKNIKTERDNPSPNN